MSYDDERHDREAVSTVHCWLSRYEALGFANIQDALVDLPDDELDRYAVEVGAEWNRDDDRHWLVGLDAICLLEDGHDGPHAYTRTDAIAVTFPPPAAS